MNDVKSHCKEVRALAQQFTLEARKMREDLIKLKRNYPMFTRNLGQEENKPKIRETSFLAQFSRRTK